MPQIIPFQITLSLQVIRRRNTPNFHLTLRQQRKKFQIFFNSPQTLNLVIKLNFRKKSEISKKFKISKKSEISEKSEFSVFKKIFKNYLIFLFYKMEKDDRKK